MRLLSADYSGDCITVRRASDNATQNIGFDDDGVLDITSLESFCAGTDGFVTTWFDQSGNGNNATQTIAANQPQVVSSGSVILEDGKSTIEAIDINYALTLPFTGATQMTTVTVSRMYDISSNRYITDSASGRYIVGVFSNTDKYTAFRSTALSGDTAQTTQSSLYFATFDGVNSTFTNDGGTTYTGDTGTSTFTELRLLGGVGGFNGNVQEIIIYKSDQSSNRTGIEDNINDYYNIY